MARKKPKTMQELYDQFEKWCKSDNDYRKRLEEQNDGKPQNSKSQFKGSDSNKKQQGQPPQMINIEQ